MKTATSRMPQARRATLTLRCRLFQHTDPCTCGATSGHYSEVWDSLERPYSGELPVGVVVAEESSASEQEVRDRIMTHRKRLGVVTAGEWGVRVGP